MTYFNFILGNYWIALSVLTINLFIEITRVRVNYSNYVNKDRLNKYITQLLQLKTSYTNTYLGVRSLYSWCKL